MKRNVWLYLLVSFSWTWACWIGGAFLIQLNGYALDTDATLFEVIGAIGSEKSAFPQLLFALGVFGPFLGSVIAGKPFKDFFSLEQRSFSIYAWMIPLVIVIPTLIMSFLFSEVPEGKVTFGSAASTIGLYFLSNLLTSGTEEFGWRGFLYPYLRSREKNFWEATWKGGIIWAAWHYPFLIIMYMGQGMFVLLLYLIGFTAGIVAMNYLTNFVFKKTESIPTVMAMHALNNTASYALLLFFPRTPFMILVYLTTWAVVGYVEKKHHLD